MPKKTPTPLISVKRGRTTPYQTDFAKLKADVLADTRVTKSPLSTTYLPVDLLRRGRYQPRTLLANDPALDELVASIKELGVIEPVAVRPLPGQPDVYEILAGDRRWRAAQKAGLEQIPVIVHAVDDRTAAAIALVENLQREDLNPIEEAVALRRLLDDFTLTQAQVGELVSKSESAVSKSLGLLKLPQRVQEMLQQGEIEAGHAKVLLNLAPAEQLSLAMKAAQRGWSVRQLERHKTALKDKSRVGRAAYDNADVRRLETSLGEWFCAPVRLKPNGKGGGKIEIAYSSAGECENILQKFGFNAKGEFE